MSEAKRMSTKMQEERMDRGRDEEEGSGQGSVS